MHLGLILGGQQIAPPSEFALAEIGNMTYDDIKLSLEEIVANPKAIDINDTPMLREYIDRGELRAWHLGYLASRRHGSRKMITRKATTPINREGNALRFTKNDQIVGRVESREVRVKRHPEKARGEKTEYHGPSNIHFYNPFKHDKLYFKGGTPHHNFNAEKGHHWSEGLRTEKMYLDSLTVEQRAQFDVKTEVIDYEMALIMIEANRLVKSGTFHMFAGGGDFQGREPVLPFDFSIRQSSNLNEKYGVFKYAVEAFLSRYGKPAIVRQVLEHETGDLNLAEVDRNLLGKTGFVTPKMKSLYEDGKVIKGAILNRKRFEGGTWAIIQAIEEYFFSQERLFNQYSMEFTQTPEFTAASIVFDVSPESDKRFSMRIIFDDNFGLPFIQYKTPDPTPHDMKFVRLEDPSTIDPTKMVNIPTNKSGQYRRGWIDRDWRTPVRCLNTLFEPYDHILRRAADISRRGKKPLDYSTVKDAYFHAMHG